MVNDYYAYHSQGLHIIRVSSASWGWDSGQGWGVEGQVIETTEYRTDDQEETDSTGGQ